VSSTSDLKVGFIGKIDVVEDHSIGFRGGRKGRKKVCLFKGPAKLESSQGFQGRHKIATEGGEWSRMRYLFLNFDDANQDYLPQRDMEAIKDLESSSLWHCDVDRLPSWVSEFPKLACLILIGCSSLLRYFLVTN
jgi:hypothetical protein